MSWELQVLTKLQITSFHIEVTNCKLRVKLELQFNETFDEPNFDTASC